MSKNIGANLVGKFHAHLTMNVSVPEIKGWKPTTIILSGEKEQTDVMLTKHYFVPSRKTPTVDDIYADIKNTCENVKVLRVKIEHESLPTVAPSEKTYRECHIKIFVPHGISCEYPDGYVRSRNPKQVSDDGSIFFLNRRWYSGSIESINKELQDLVLDPAIQIHETKVESTIFDSNKELDAWWA